jgi:hypothetical protein
VAETPTPVPVASSSQQFEEDIRSTSRSGIADRIWSAIGRAAVGLAIIGTGALIAFTSMRANSWFGHLLTPDPVAGEVYSHLSVAAEVIACLSPTAIRFYWHNGERWTALRGGVLIAVALVVVLFAAGKFAVTNLAAGTQARGERSTVDTTLARRRLDTIIKSRQANAPGADRSAGTRRPRSTPRLPSPERLQADVKAGAYPKPRRSVSVLPGCMSSRRGPWWRSARSVACSSASGPE